jgi:CubicO group peptidase (beta-lactamase class C family)
MNETELLRVSDQAFEKTIGKTIGGAVIVVMKDDKIAFEKSYGYADTEHKRPIDPTSTIFEYGSVTK